MISVNDLQFYDNGLENFFNENETEINSYVQNNGTGVYKLTQNKETSQFTAVEKVDNVPDGSTINEGGRVFIVGESDSDELFVKFVI